MLFRVVRGDTLAVMLERGESVKAEADALVTMPEGLEVTGRMDGGILSSMARMFLSGETFFVQVVKAHDAGEALLAPVVPGELSPGHSLMMKRGAYLASAEGVHVSTAVQRGVINSMFSGTGLFLLRAEGSGPVAFSSYGTIHCFTLKNNERRVVDNGHVMAWTDGMNFTVDFAQRRSMLSSFKSGEGLMCYFTGPGKIWVQSRNETAFHQWIAANNTQTPNGRGSSRQLGCVGTAIFFLVFIGIFVLAAFVIFTSESNEIHIGNSRYQRV